MWREGKKTHVYFIIFLFTRYCTEFYKITGHPSRRELSDKFEKSMKIQSLVFFKFVINSLTAELIFANSNKLKRHI